LIVRWQDNKAAFARGQNFAIGRQKFLNGYYSVFSQAVVTPGLPIGALSFISVAGLSGISAISSAISGSFSLIEQDAGVKSGIGGDGSTGSGSEMS
jgi:hypothetical protein